jgi:hypothetical protein
LGINNPTNKLNIKNVLMKKLRLYKYIFLFIISSSMFFTCTPEKQKPRVIITTDINNAGGDPDDKQSLVHVLWYADELDIVGIVPDYWSGKGYEASMEVLDTYKKDYAEYSFMDKGYPDPQSILSLFAGDASSAMEMIKQEASVSDDPLYVLIWGQMTTFQKALFESPEISDKVRILTIATWVKYGPADEQVGEKCDVVNWNGRGRNEIYKDPRFNNLWWLESNWTYNGMFMGDGPKIMFEKLSNYGSMGAFIKTATKGHDWAQYFRVGDTPTVLYLIDPCNSWEHVVEMYAYNKSTLFDRREDMYDQLLKKLDKLYNR